MHTYEAHYDYLFSAAGPDLLERQRSACKSVDDYFAILGSAAQQSGLYNPLYDRVAHLFIPSGASPVERASDAQSSPSNAFLTGAVPALYLVETLLSDDFKTGEAGMLSRLEGYGCLRPELPPPSRERVHKKATLANQVILASSQGLTAAPMYQSFLTDYAVTVETDDTNSWTAIRRGFGFVMSLVVHTREERTSDDALELDIALYQKAEVGDDAVSDTLKPEDYIIDWDEAWADAQQAAVEANDVEPEEGND